MGGEAGRKSVKPKGEGKVGRRRRRKKLGKGGGASISCQRNASSGGVGKFTLGWANLVTEGPTPEARSDTNAHTGRNHVKSRASQSAEDLNCDSPEPDSDRHASRDLGAGDQI